jgi:hypothetical protein
MKRIMILMAAAALMLAAGYFAGATLPSPLMRMTYYELKIKDPEEFQRAISADPRWQRDGQAFAKTLHRIPGSNQDLDRLEEWIYHWQKNHHVGGDWFE